MITDLAIFIAALATLLLAAKFFTSAAEKIGAYFRLPPFVIGVFIVGIGTSLPELISGTLSVNKGVSEILSGNVIGANISNILLITGLAVAFHKRSIILKSHYLYIDLHFLLGSFMFIYMIAYDGSISFTEAFIGIVIFIVYSVYLIKGEAGSTEDAEETGSSSSSFPVLSFIVLLVACAGIYFGADYTISSLESIAIQLSVPKSIVALTLLSLGTTLPELVVNISAIRKGKAEMAIGNVLGSCIFNTLMTPSIGSAFGEVTVPESLLHFSLPVMAASGVLFYLLTQDKKISVWEGLMFVCLYTLFILKTSIG